MAQQSLSTVEVLQELSVSNVTYQRIVSAGSMIIIVITLYFCQQTLKMNAHAVAIFFKSLKLKQLICEVKFRDDSKCQLLPGKFPKPDYSIYFCPVDTHSLLIFVTSSYVLIKRPYGYPRVATFTC